MGGEGPGWDGTLNGVNVELGTYIVTSHAQDDLQGKKLFDRVRSFSCDDLADIKIKGGHIQVAFLF